VLRIFLCHASDDKPKVRELCTRLREDGFDPWLDEEQLLPGQDWELQVSAAVQASDVVVVCLSLASVGKVGYVQKELRLVLDAAQYQPEGRIFVIPVRLEDCALPIRLRQWQYADLFASGGYDRLRSALNARAEGQSGASLLISSSSGAPVVKQRAPHRLFVLAAILLLLIAAAVAYLATDRASHPALIVSKAFPPVVAHMPVAEPPGMVRIPDGRFLMGRSGSSHPESSPAHEVAVAAFYLDRIPVTNARFRDFLKLSRSAAPSSTSAKDLDHDDWPVTRISWDEADAYCLAQGKRLPTEAEWEFAARGADGRLYPWGENFDPSAVNSRETGPGHPEPAGTRQRNVSPHGVRDMSGNVWQWCSDEYHSYPGGRTEFAIPPGAKVIRGGSYQSDRQFVTSVTRNLDLPSARSPAIGFRCAK
jgi:formylglycine-generating enzyme required for sulfatase activity